MRYPVLLTLAVSTIATIGMSQTPPPNDDCASATVIAGLGSFPFDNTAATTGAQGQNWSLCGVASANWTVPLDVWYAWTSPITGAVRVSSCLQTVNTKIAVYAGTGCSVIPMLACNDDACGGGLSLQSRVTVPVTAGATYTIQVGVSPGAIPPAPVVTSPGGMGTFEISDASPPANDNCTTPFVISGAGPHPYNSSYATTGAQGQAESICMNLNSTALRDDEWFLWTPSVTGTATLTTCSGRGVGSGSNTKVAIYLGAGCPAASAIACNDDDIACGVFVGTSTVTWATVCGQPYTIQLGRSPFEFAATYGTFDIVQTGPPCGVFGVGYCFGNGSGTPCPCGNVGAALNGCPDSLNASGANLSAVGPASIGFDGLVLVGTGMSNSSALYFQGTTETGGGAGSVFGDGKRCAGGSVIRLGTQSNSLGQSSYPEIFDPAISVQGMITFAPQTRTYQVWYRNAAAFCTAATFNLTNGLSVVWVN